MAQRDVLERAEARASAAEQEASAEREKCRRVMEAAAKGNLPLVTTPGEGALLLMTVLLVTGRIAFHLALHLSSSRRYKYVLYKC